MHIGKRRVFGIGWESQIVCASAIVERFDILERCIHRTITKSHPFVSQQSMVLHLNSCESFLFIYFFYVYSNVHDFHVNDIHIEVL